MSETSTKIIRPHAGFQEKFVRSNVDVVIGGGVLNPQPVDSLVATPCGFVRIGDLKAGDIICDTKGGTQQVNFVLDKGMQQCVEFTLMDGRTVESALSHNWLVGRTRVKDARIEAKDIIAHIDAQEGKSAKRVSRYFIPACEPVSVEDKFASERTIHPYLLGCLLGDGWFSEKKFYIGFCTNDDEMIKNIASLGYNIKKDQKNPKDIHYEIRDKHFKGLISKLGLLGKHAESKFIPECYKNAPTEVKLELIKGLFDTDGTCSVSKVGKVRCGYRTISKQLAFDIRDIIWSIGGRCKIHTTPAKIRTYGEKTIACAESYGLLVWLKNDKDLFKLSRKKDRAKGEGEKKNEHKLSIRDYRLTGEKHCVCINVSGEDHLYLTNNYVVTCNCGKTTGAVLMCAEPSLDTNFRGVFLRNNLGDLRSGGGILDEFKKMYRGGVNVIESGEPRVEFPSGARVDVTHIADQTRDKVRQRFKGRQYDLIYFDEMTGFSWDCFTEVCTRNRGTGKWTGKIRGTTNPERDHWLRTFLDWYIGVDGFIREDREGVVRYFYMNGATVKDVVWGDDKESVYQKCKIDIDRKLAKINGKTGKTTYKDMIRSFTFYLGRMSENVSSIENNSGYVGAVAMSGGANSEQLLEGNWNVSNKNDADAPIQQDLANQTFTNDEMRNGDRWVTCDLADTGTDNFVAIAWDGFHILDVLILGRTTPRDNAEYLKMFAGQYDVADSHIVYDGIRGTYINDYIPDAVPFFSYYAPVGLYSRLAQRLKDECYLRLVEVIKRGELSWADNLAYKVYEHQKLKENITIQNEFLEECSVVRFTDMPSGKKRLFSKKEMNSKLGKGRSMDLLDPIAMRMYPVLECAYGDELKLTAQVENDNDDYNPNKQSVYDETWW